MQSKRVFLFSIISLCLILSITSVSAFSFSNWFGKLTGKIVADDGLGGGSDYYQTGDESAIGVTDGVSSTGIVSGWARDPDYQATGQYIEVQIYIDNAYAGSVTANQPSEAEVGGNGNHRFYWTVPDKYYDGKQHEVWAYAIGKLSDGSLSNSNVQMGSPSYQSRIFTYSVRTTCSSFTYSAWSSCLNGLQNRTIASSSPAGCTGGSPVTTQVCAVTNTTSTSSSCLDSDNGLNYSLSGNVKFSNYTVNLTFSDYCSGNSVVEYYCPTPQTYSLMVYGSCQYGCSNGACQGPKTSSCGDSDYGTSYYSPGEIYFANISTTLTLKDYCSDSTLIEFYCKNISNIATYATSVISCENGCLNDACLMNYILGKEDSFRYGQTFRAGTHFITVKGIAREDVDILVDNSTKKNLFIGEKYPLDNDYTLVINGSYNYTGPRLLDPWVNLTVYKNPINSQVCSDLINKVSSSSDFEIYGQKYLFSWNQSPESINWWIDGAERKATHYSTGWYTTYDSDENDNSGYEYHYLSYSIDVFEDKSLNLTKYIEEQNQYNICSVQSYWSSDNTENKIFVCNYDPLESDVTQYPSQDNQVFWIHDNVLVRASIGSSKYINDEALAKAYQTQSQEILSSIKNNKFKPVDWSKFNIQYPVSNVIAEDLVSCSSQIPNMVRSDTNETCYPYWNCKTEPAICPPHGYQTRICEDFSCGQKREDKIQCSPGLCSGCTTPRWFGQQYSDNVCIPYGFRFAAPSGESVKLVETNDTESLDESESKEYSLKIISSTSAKITFVGESKNYTYDLALGQETDITESLLDMKSDEVVSASITPTRISTGTNNNGYVEFKVNFKYNEKSVDTFNAYCDIDGEIKAQKDRTSDGNWAKCQNNYECSSNVCSSGECIEVQDLIAQGSGIKKVVAKILCRISSALTSETYEECLAGLQ